MSESTKRKIERKRQREEGDANLDKSRLLLPVQLDPESPPTSPTQCLHPTPSPVSSAWIRAPAPHPLPLFSFPGSTTPAIVQHKVGGGRCCRRRLSLLDEDELTGNIKVTILHPLG
jgi:hypothetical protein